MTKEELEYACSLLPEGSYWGDNITAQMALHIAQAARATPADQEPASQEKFEWARKVYDVSESVPGELQRFWDCAVKSAGVKND